MGELAEGLRTVLVRLWTRPDELMLESGAGGERMVARMRVVVALLLLPVPLLLAIQGHGLGTMAWAMGFAVLVNAAAQVLLALAHDRRRYPWLPYASSSWDVTVTTAALTLLAFHNPTASASGGVAWSVYLLAISMTALRNDGRLTAWTGLLAMLQYGVLVLLVLPSLLPPPPSAPLDNPTHAALLRLGLVGTMTVLTAAIVHRIQGLIELSGRDGLTGLPNRSWLLQRLPRAFEAAGRDGGSLSVALLDMDHFKRINEDFGHRAGDLAIRRVASELQGILREDEHLVRLTGQEFVLLLCDPIGSAWERVDRVRRELHAHPFHGEPGAAGASSPGHSFPLTFSAGLAAWPADGNNTASLLRCADLRMQSAKRDGRNRVYLRET